MYVTLFPCNECAKSIIQSGIKEIVYLSDKYHDADMSIASRRLLRMAGVNFRAYQHRTGNQLYGIKQRGRLGMKTTIIALPDW